MGAPIQSLDISNILLDGTQTREAMSEDTIAEYAAIYKARKVTMPPLVVYFDGEHYWLGDGFHRLQAIQRAGSKQVRCEVRMGGKRDAIRFGFTANDAHGLRRSNADKRRAVNMALDDDEWAGWSDRAIADLCGVSDRLVNKMREERSTANGSQLNRPSDAGNADSAPPATRKGRDGKSRKVPDKQPEREPFEAGSSSANTDGQGGTDAPLCPEALAACQDAEKAIKQAIAVLEAFEATPESAWLMRTSGKSQARIGLEKAKQDIFVSRPSEPCAKCRGKGCDHCRKTGWLPKYMTTKNAKSARAPE